MTTATPAKRPVTYTVGQVLAVLTALALLGLAAGLFAAAADQEGVAALAKEMQTTEASVRSTYWFGGVFFVLSSAILLVALLLSLRARPGAAKAACHLLSLWAVVHVAVSFFGGMLAGLPLVLPMAGAAWCFWGPRGVREWLAARVGKTLRELEGQTVVEPT